jgi:hypothetical protein
VHVVTAALRLAAVLPGERMLEVGAESFGDNGSLDAGDDCVDVVVGTFPAIPAPVQLREMIRIARPGGRVGVVVDDAADENDVRWYFASAMRAAGSPYRVIRTDARRLRRRLLGAGVADVVVAHAVDELSFPNGEALWEWVVRCAPVDDSPKEGVVQVLDGMLRDNPNVTASFAVAVGTKPDVTDERGDRK